MHNIYLHETKETKTITVKISKEEKLLHSV